MTLSNMGQMGVLGQIIALLGIAILGTFRAEVLEWAREFLDIWRGQITGNDPLLADPAYMRLRPRRQLGAVFLIFALALVFIGQMLFLLDLNY